MPIDDFGENETGEVAFPGYPDYPPSDDIYEKGKVVPTLNSDDPSINITPNEKVGSRNEKDFKEDSSGDDLDVPGSELDDAQEIIGNEDEENNYYSLGGDDHNDLEEDRG
jgi:hypothetical protein